MEGSKIAVVTGANKGLGLETCRQLASRGLTVILCSRDREKGQAALDRISAPGMDLHFHQLDVTDVYSITALSVHIRRHYGRLDVLVNNAGIFPDTRESNTGTSVFDTSLEVVRRGMETNTYGPLLLCQLLIPVMAGHGRVVNVSSGMGQLAEMNGGFPGYRLSKTALNALTRIFADELKGTGVKVNSVCPGWVRTDMGGKDASLSPEEGVDTIVWLATLPDDGPSGGFFRERMPIPW